ncbi:hypothetical protein [Pseudomonas sp. MWU13-3659]|uniref:hypothetical protein n=1 Tax=Pseudomonas sp. MWU13-3659 TaxID=2986964 RepID=UPI00336A4937
MDNDLPADHGQLGWTVGTCTFMEGATKGTRLFRVEPGNCATTPWNKPPCYSTALAVLHSLV